MSAPLFSRYGSYSHPAGEVIISSMSCRVEWSARGEPVLERWSMACEGIKQADDVNALNTALAALEAAYQLQGLDGGLCNSNGSPTAHFLTSGDALGGVRSSGISYPSSANGEYSTWRTYSFTLEADYQFTSTSLLEFTETIQFTGTGGKRFVYLFPLNGKPVKQTVQQYTTMRAVQSGSALGYLQRPNAPSPLWPDDEHEEERSITKTSPRVVRGKEVDFGIQWSYTFESGGSLGGNPRSS